MRRRTLWGCLAAATLFGAAVFVAVTVHDEYTHPAPGNGERVMFTVRPGESFSSVAKRLAAAGLVERPRLLVLSAWVRGWDRRVKAGTYALVRGSAPRDLVGALVAGDVYKVTVTVPEGFRYDQIAAALAAAADVDSTAFNALLTDPAVLERLDVQGPSLEGYLFPDTYLIPWGMGAEEIAAMMKARLDAIFDDEMRQRVGELGLTLNEALTLASIIQAETRLPEEFPLVSAVYHNRLRKGMKLEADPTVAYALGGYKDRIYYKDLEADSPYNTYKHEGLPPGPICAPGKAAIVAALHPDTTCHALYFVARGDGGHIFSTTLEEHLRAVEKVRREKALSRSK